MTTRCIRRTKLSHLVSSVLLQVITKKCSHHLLHGAQVSVVLLSVLILFQPVMGNWGASQQRDCVPGTRSPCFLTSALFVTLGTRKSFRSPSPSQEPSHIRHLLFVPIHLAAHSLGKVRSCLVNVWKRESGQLKKFYQGAISKIQLFLAGFASSTNCWRSLYILVCVVEVKSAEDLQVPSLFCCPLALKDQPNENQTN